MGPAVFFTDTMIVDWSIPFAITQSLLGELITEASSAPTAPTKNSKLMIIKIPAFARMLFTLIELIPLV